MPVLTSNSLTTSSSEGVITIDYVIGMPPITTNTGEAIHTQRSAEALKNTMPVATIYPGIPSFEFGIDLFNRLNAFDSGLFDSRDQKSNNNYYLPMLRKHGYNLDKNIHINGLKVAYIADNFPTDTFTNEYGENFLQKFTDVASEGAASIAQMFGARDVRDVGRQIIGRAQGSNNKGIGKIGEMANQASKYIGDLGQTLFGNTGSRMANMIGSLAAGSRIDFPMVWKSSSFQPSYTMTVRLYNPNPGSLRSTQKYIIGPIAAIMLLGIPISQDSSTYSWPFLHKVSSPGIYNLDPAYIQNITVVKGGDQQQISYRQSLSIVDVRIDFGSLFSSMLATSDSSEKTRPTLRKYLKAMEPNSQKESYKITGGTLKNPNFSDEKSLSSNLVGSGRNQQAFVEFIDTLDAETPEEPPSRVDQTIKDIATELEDLIPKGFRIGTT